MQWVDTFKPILATSRVILELNPFGILIRGPIHTGRPMVPCALKNSGRSNGRALFFLPLIWLFVVKLLKTHSDKKCRSWSYLDQVLCHSRHAGAAAMPKWDADCQKINAKYALTKDYMSFKQAMDVLPLRNWVSFKAWPKITTAGFAQRHS